MLEMTIVMRKKREDERIQPDLEEVFQISAEIEIVPSEIDFSGMAPIQIEIKKRVHKQTQIENVDLRNTSKGSLF